MSSNLYKRIQQDKAAQEFIEKHKDEFRPNSYKDQPISHYERVQPNRFIVEIIRDCMPFKRADRQELAELFLQMTPSKIAAVKGWSDRKTYKKLYRLKQFATRIYQRKRDALLNARSSDRGLETLPEYVALRKLYFSFANREQEVFLVELNGQETWVDAVGKPFQEEIQEVLHNLAAERDGFEALDVDE